MKVNLQDYEELLQDVLKRALLYRKKRIEFDNLYQSVARKIQSGPGYSKKNVLE